MCRRPFHLRNDSSDASAVNFTKSLRIVSLPIAHDEGWLMAHTRKRCTLDRLNQHEIRCTIRTRLHHTQTLDGKVLRMEGKDNLTEAFGEVHEADGSTFTDILPATARPHPTPKDERENEKPKHRGTPKRKTTAPVEVEAGEGFVAGEDVAVALIVSHTTARPDGSVRALIDPALIEATGARKVILFGQISGTTTVRGLS